MNTGMCLGQCKKIIGHIQTITCCKRLYR